MPLNELAASTHLAVLDRPPPAGKRRATRTAAERREPPLTDDPVLHEADLRAVTILFADVRGFTRLSEALPAERLVGAINSVFEALDGPIARYGGEVDKFMGDAIMATFGAPVAHEDDPRRAVLAALEMHAVLRRVNRRLRTEIGCELEMRIGINTGVVLAGPIGSRRKRTYTVMGDAVNVASRLEHAAPVGGVAVGEATRAHVGQAFRLRLRRSLCIRGKETPVRSYVVLGLAEGARRKFRASERCPGRQAEVRQIRAALVPLRDERRAVVRISGQMGVGKSRVIQAARERSTGRGWLHAACPPYGQDLPYATLAGLLRAVLANLERHRGASALDDVIAEASAADGLDPQLAAGVVRDLLSGSAESDRNGTSTLHPQLRKGLLARATKALLRRSADRPGGCVVVLDDCQWLDAASAAIIREAIADLGRIGLGWLLAHRPEWEPPADWPVETHVPIAPLGTDASTQVVDALLGQAVDRDVAAFIVDRAGGNPLHLVELCRAIADDGSAPLSVEALRRQAAAPDGPRYLTDRLRGLIQARVDALDDRARRIVNVAAVLGHAFPARLLRRVLGKGDWATVLSRLEDQGILLREARARGDGTSTISTWRFRHPLLQETAYASLLSSTRTTLHRTAGAALEDMSDEVVPDRLALLALHFGRSDDRERAVRYLCAAGDRARALYLNREAIRYYDDALGRLGTTGEDRSARARVLAGRGAALEVLAEDEAAIESLRAAVELETRQEVRSDLWCQVAEIYRRRGAYGAAREELDRAEVALDSPDHVLMRARVGIARSMLARDCRDYAQARAIAQEAIELLEGQALPRDLAAARRALGIAAAQAGDLVAAQEVLDQGLEAARDGQDTLLAASIATNLGTVLRYQGRYAHARERYQESLAFYERIGAKRQIARSWINLGDLAWRDGDGDWETAHEHWDRALRLLEEIGDKRNIALVLVNLGEGHTQRRDFTAAEPILQHLRRLAHELDDAELLDMAERHLARGALGSGA